MGSYQQVQTEHNSITQEGVCDGPSLLATQTYRAVKVLPMKVGVKSNTKVSQEALSSFFM